MGAVAPLPPRSPCSPSRRGRGAVALGDQIARVAGVEDGRLDQALTAAEDASIPHRKAAREQQKAIVEEQDVFRAEMYGARIIHGIGSPSELNQASTMSKMLEWRKQNGLYPVPGTAGASNGVGAGDGASGGDASAQ